MRYSFCLDFEAGLLGHRHNAFLESCRQFGLSISVWQGRIYKVGSWDSLPGLFLGETGDIRDLEERISDLFLLPFPAVPVADFVANQIKEFN